MVTVCTVLPPPERPRLDAVGDGCFTALHANSFRDALRAARRKRVDALVLSVHSCRGDELPAVARFVREFPAIPAVALVSRHDREVTETLLRLGATGVRTAGDCTGPAGGRRLRGLLGHPPSPPPGGSRPGFPLEVSRELFVALCTPPYGKPLRVFPPWSGGLGAQGRTGAGFSGGG